MGSRPRPCSSLRMGCCHRPVLRPGGEAAVSIVAVAHVDGNLRVRTYCARCGKMLTDNPSLDVGDTPRRVSIAGELAAATWPVPLKA